MDASWEGPFVVVDKVSEVTYAIVPKGHKRKGKSKVVHINLLKEFNEGFEVRSVVAVTEDVSGDREDVVESYIHPELAPEQKSELVVVLHNHSVVFANKPGNTQSATHSIKVTCEHPVWTPSYAIPASVEKGFQSSLEELLALDIIEPSNSKWSSPPIPIVKKDGDVRIVVDYRKVNEVTIPEPFQMPTIQEILSRLGKAKYLSKLDLMKGFHQVPVDPESRKYTAFSCRHGKFHYKRMPFGLRNAPATFQLLMQEVLRGMEDFSSPYIDDVIIYSCEWKLHLSHIDQVLSALGAHGLTVKRAKCRWGYRVFEFLGFEVGDGKVGIPSARVLQLQQYVQPKTVSQLRSFLGLANFYSQFIPHFADLTRLLTEHTKRSSPRRVLWTTDMTDAFNSIILSISNSSKLVVPVASDVFALFCDASTCGVGGVLCVYREEKWVPTAFYSRQMKPRETRYSATEIEALAMVVSIEHFSYYLYGVEFVVYTDHKALTHLFQSNVLNNRLWRWRVKLMDYSFSIIYIQGHSNVVADALSRQGWPEASKNQGKEEIDLQHQEGGDVVELPTTFMEKQLTTY